jgi:hypothetical protein
MSSTIIILIVLIAVAVCCGIVLIGLALWNCRKAKNNDQYQVAGLPLGYVDGVNEEFDSISSLSSAESDEIERSSPPAKRNPNNVDGGNKLQAIYAKLDANRDIVVASHGVGAEPLPYYTSDLMSSNAAFDRPPTDLSAAYSTKLEW